MLLTACHSLLAPVPLCLLVSLPDADPGVHNFWQAKDISRAVRWCQPEDDMIDIALLEHISTIEWDDEIPCRQYVLNHVQVR
jgi:hypothetical protein